MLQLEVGASEPEVTLKPGLEYLVGAFPDEDESFNLSGYSAGKVCVFLSIRPDSLTLPSQPQAGGLLRRMAEQARVGGTPLYMELTPAERDVVLRLAEVYIEVVISGTWRGFPLLMAYREPDGQAEIWVSQGFCDLVHDRWELWNAGQGGVECAAVEPAPSLDISEPEQEVIVEAPAPMPRPPRVARDGFGHYLRRLAGSLSAGRGVGRDSSAHRASLS